MGDFGTVTIIVHHQKLKISDIADGELVESVRKHISRSSIRTVTNIGHQGSTTEATSAATIDTSGLSPVLLPSNQIGKAYVHSLELVSLETRERSCLLLHNFHLTNRTHGSLKRMLVNMLRMRSPRFHPNLHPTSSNYPFLYA